MKIKRSFFVIAVLAFSSGGAAADSKWAPISGNAQSLAYAQAYCDNASTVADQGYFAYGNSGYLLGAALGNAIGNAIREQRFFTNCMTMMGWQKVHIPGTPNGMKPQGREK